jgi:hypothetical protein
MAYGKGGSGAVGAIRDFSSLLIGQDPFATEKIWETLFKKTFWGQGGGTVIFTAISALDIALWDIKGKATRSSRLSAAGRENAFLIAGIRIAAATGLGTRTIRAGKNRRLCGRSTACPGRWI